MNNVAQIERTDIVEADENNAVTPMMMIARALEKGGSPETLEKMLALQERWEANEARKAYVVAMALAQAEMRPVSADASNPQTKSKYASYHALDGAIRPIYSRHGFSVSFNSAPADENSILILCNLAHSMGHVQPFNLPMPCDGKGAKGGDVMTKTHAMGAAITYGRRYLLGMVFNIAVGDDNDGNTRNKLIEGSEAISADEFIFIRNLIEELGVIEEKVLSSVKASSLETMTVKQYREAVSKLQAWAKKRTQNDKATT
jgi:ERF superfamily